MGIQPWLDKWNLISGEPWQEAIEEALDVIEPLALLERIAAQLLQAWYRRRLQYLVAAVPRWAGERILSASKAIRATGSGMPTPRVIGGRQ